MKLTTNMQRYFRLKRVSLWRGERGIEVAMLPGLFLADVDNKQNIDERKLASGAGRANPIGPRTRLLFNLTPSTPSTSFHPSFISSRISFIFTTDIFRAISKDSLSPVSNIEAKVIPCPFVLYPSGLRKTGAFPCERQY